MQPMHTYIVRTLALLLSLFYHITNHQLHAQSTTALTQTLKGVVLDKALKTPLIGATVRVVSVTPAKGTVTDVEGRFRLPQLPVGKHVLRVTYIGYKEATLPNVTLISGKETEISIEMEENILQGQEVVITAKVEKQKALNELSTVSARTFSVEETQRFAAAVNDPARMASSFAGVAMPADGNNIITIRGNAPNGLLWRMEGVDIPNPNHFSNVGSSGGGISILSAQLLTNSDFLTGAFPAEYGNATSGVFDLKMRKGNTDKREHTLQAGVLGLDVATEGPLRLGKQRGSYLVNYRYSTLSLLGKLGVPLGDAVTNFQDLSYNIYLPAGRAGVFTLFGMGGNSNQRYFGKADSLQWSENPSLEYDGLFTANSGVAGLTHSLILGDRTSMKTVVAYSGTENADRTDRYDNRYERYRFANNRFVQRKLTVSSTFNHKFSPKHLLRVGGYANFLDYDLQQKLWSDEENALQVLLANDGRTTTLNGFAQYMYRPTPKLTLTGGFHTLALLLNNTVSVEPRAAVKYQWREGSSIGFGYGKHGQIQPLGVYFTKIYDDNGVESQPNRDLGMTQAHHFVLSYDQTFRDNWHIKPELYFQNIQNAPVSATVLDEYSMLNQIDGFVNKALANNGAGRNYGLELTVEKFLTNGFYGMLSNSLFNAEYRGSDGQWHDTRFNAGFISSAVAGKEWNWNNAKKNRTIGVNLKFTQSGGLRETPIDLAASIEKGEAVYDGSRAFEDIMPYYLRLDTGVRLKRNYKHVTTTLSFDIQNATNRKNVFGRYYDPRKKAITTYYQAPLIPILAYKVEF
jgi:hypothetical protein